MTCEATRELLPDVLTGSPVPGVAEHLAGCAACRAEADGLRGLLERLRTTLAPADVAPPALDDVLAVARGRARSRRALGVVARAAALLLAVGLGAVVDRALLRPAAPPPPPESTAPEPAFEPGVRAVVAERPGGLAAGLALLGALSQEPRPGR